MAGPTRLELATSGVTDQRSSTSKYTIDLLLKPRVYEAEI